MSLDENFCDPANRLGSPLRGSREIHIPQTGHASAIDADKVGMLFTGRTLWVEGFKPPDVIAKFCARD